MSSVTAQPLPSARRAAAHSASGGSCLAWLGQVMEGWFLPAPLHAPSPGVQRVRAVANAGRPSLDTPTYLRRGIHIPELD
jgi:hypothetical protein